MKRKIFSLAVVIVLLSLPVLSNAQAQTQFVPCHSASHNPFAYGSTDWYDHWCANEYCCCVQQTSSDSWLLTIDPVGNEPSHYLVEYTYDLYTPNSSTPIQSPSGWQPVSWPLQFTNGAGGGYTNFRIRIVTRPPFSGGGMLLKVPSDCGPQIPYADGSVGFEFPVGVCN